MCAVQFTLQGTIAVGGGGDKLIRKRKHSLLSSHMKKRKKGTLFNETFKLLIYSTLIQ